MVGKTFRFEAAHALLGWPEDHKCRRLHGHSYKVELVTGTKDGYDPARPGALIDFAEVSAWFKREVFDKLDHRYLNDVLGWENPTAEHLCVWIAERFIKTGPPRAKLVRVRLWETEDSFAEYFPYGLVPEV
jgi:6-pyruvoyltetrahydropterin/6-carboxytetrahydropterin synthase